MNRVFADANYWIALLHPKEELHDVAVAARDRLRHATLYTSDEVLGEVLNFCSGRGQQLRALGANAVEAVRKDSRVVVIKQSRVTFDKGLALYKQASSAEFVG